MNKTEMINFKIVNENISIAKKDIKFINGLAIIEATVKEDAKDFYGMWSIEEFTYKGVINEDYNFVYGPYAYVVNIEIFPNDNIVVEENCNNDMATWIETKHYKIDQATGKKIMLRKLLDYERINDNVVKTSDYESKKGYRTVLYDIVSGKVVSQKFSSIGDFEIQKNGEILALAKNQICFKGDSRNSYDIICYINENGEIRTPLLCTYDNSITVFNTDMEYEEANEVIKQRIQFLLEEKEKNKEKALKNFWKIKV